MARPLRVRYEGALYHVITRGNERKSIFLDDIDRRKFLHWLKEVVKLHNVVVHAYCLMSNHYHLLIETPDANLSAAMRDLNGSYSQWFNTRHNRVGHLFQGRFKSFLIEKEIYLLAVARYIVLNPVRARLVAHPRNWRWSSYNMTSGTAKTPQWLSVDWLLSQFGNERNVAQKRYRTFVADGWDMDPYEELEHDFILGSPQFVSWVWDNQTAGSETLKDHPREQRIVGRPALQEIFHDEMSREERDTAIVFARVRCGYLCTEIARQVGLDRSVVGRISRGKYNIKKVRNTT